MVLTISRDFFSVSNINRLVFVERNNIFPVRYELNLYISLERNSFFDMLLMGVEVLDLEALVAYDIKIWID
jgi:hypothetical protein